MSVLSSNELRIGTVFMLAGEPWIVLKFSHNKTGRGGAVNKIKAKNLKTGSITEQGFTTNEKFDQAELNRESCQYLYKDADSHFFMSNVTFEQYDLSEDMVGDNKYYMKEGDKIILVFLDGKPISIEIPKSVTLEVTYTEPAVRGDTSGNAMKKATLDTSLEILVPMFVNIGDKIKVNTGDGTYTERAK